MILVQIIWYILLFSTTTARRESSDILDDILDDYLFDEISNSLTTTTPALTRERCGKDEVQCELANSKIEFHQCVEKNLG